MVLFPLRFSPHRLRDRQSIRSSAHSHVFKPPSYTPGTRSEGLLMNASDSSSDFTFSSVFQPAIVSGVLI